MVSEILVVPRLWLVHIVMHKWFCLTYMGSNMGSTIRSLLA